MCDRCELLEAELANLKYVLGVTKRSAETAAVRREFGVTETSARLMLALYRASGAVHKSQLHTILYGDRIDGGPDIKTIDMFVFLLRRTIGGGNVKTHFRVGYSMEPQCRDRMSKALADAA